LLNLVALLGIVLILAVAALLSSDRRKIQWRTPLAALALTLAIAAVFFLAPAKCAVLDLCNRAVLRVLDCADDGIAFLFGHLADPSGGKFVLAIQALPLIIFFAALVSLLYHLGVMQKIILLFARTFCRLFGISGAEALVAASNIFVGVESALTVRPYLEKMTKSELFLLLTVGMCTIASSVLALYVMALKDVFPQIAVHLISASLISAPAAVCIAKLMCPETEEPLTLGRVVAPEYTPATNVVESILNGANEGLKMLLGICAALIAFIGLVSLLNLILTTVGALPNRVLPVPLDWTVQGLLGYVFYPFTLALGVPAGEAMPLAKLFGERLVLTEVSAYFSLQHLIQQGALSPRSVLVATYVLCGFAHVASMAIFVGGAAALAPSRLPLLSRLGLRALVAANLACLLTGATASLFYRESLQVLIRPG